jgi:hypothetical protein
MEEWEALAPEMRKAALKLESTGRRGQPEAEIAVPARSKR